MDVRQVMGAVLTFSMFMMLGNMIKRDHFEGDVLLDIPATAKAEQDFKKPISNADQDYMKTMRHSLFELSKGLRKSDAQPLKLCWNNTSLPKGNENSKGFVTFSLTDGPEYHISQIANAVLVAKHLDATLVLPEIVGSKGEKRGFEEIYDMEKFLTVMNGVIRVQRHKTPGTSTKKLVSVKVPYNANRNYIMTNIKPLFQKTQNVRVVTYFPSSTMGQGKVDKDMDPHSCWATFEALRLKPELQAMVDSLAERLRNHGQNGQFAAIDYKGALLGKGICQSNANKERKNCYNPVEIAQFLQRIGYPLNATIYMTQSKADRSIGAVKDLYHNTLTKEDITNEDEKGKLLNSELEQDIIDFHLCSISDIFMPAKSGLFYANVVGNRIATGKIDILVPAQITSDLAQNHVSSYISKRSHPAYACFC
uniref:protein MANNAN SYNTHESIS-RELATED 1-like n=1 Tax=Erigeron canadensis TaxID=72917 RepID=UPI001CB973CF|nr:protein MANNAN SYNTHESIS-RELATED 1-like [Erigeron canadensis]